MLIFIQNDITRGENTVIRFLPFVKGAVFRPQKSKMPHFSIILYLSFGT